MRVKDLIEEIRDTSGSSINTFLNLNPNADPEYARKARRRFIVRVNNSIKEISYLFAINNHFIESREDVISVNDRNFMEFGIIEINGDYLTPREFSHMLYGKFYEKVNFNTIKIIGKKPCDVVRVNYFCTNDLVNDWEDEIPIPNVFLDAIKKHIVMVETTPENTQNEQTPSFAFNHWKEEVEKLTNMGHRKLDLISYSDTANINKGWFEWV